MKIPFASEEQAAWFRYGIKLHNYKLAKVKFAWCWETAARKTSEVRRDAVLNAWHARKDAHKWIEPRRRSCAGCRHLLIGEDRDSDFRCEFDRDLAQCGYDPENGYCHAWAPKQHNNTSK